MQIDHGGSGCARGQIENRVDTRQKKEELVDNCMQNVFQKGDINIRRVKNPVIERVELSEGIGFGAGLASDVLKCAAHLYTDKSPEAVGRACVSGHGRRVFATIVASILSFGRPSSS